MGAVKTAWSFAAAALMLAVFRTSPPYLNEVNLVYRVSGFL
jgi:hypothetical protein